MLSEDKSRLVAYQYGSGVNAQTLSPDDVIDYRMFNLSNPYYGYYSPLQAAYPSVDIQISAVFDCIFL